MVTIIFNITWCTWSNRSLACGFLIIVKIGLISKYFRKGVKYRLNWYPLSNTTFCGNGYLLSHVLLNNCIDLSDDLSIYSLLPPVTSSRSYFGTLTISNQPVVGLIIIIQLILALFLIIAPHVCCYLVDLLYGPIRYKCIMSHGFSYLMLLDGRCQ